MSRRFIASACVLSLVCLTSAAPASNILTNELYVAGSAGSYTNASAIAPVTDNDILLGLTPIASNYSGCCEALNGTTAPLTDGKTATDGNSDKNQITNNQNSLFDLAGQGGSGPQPWYVEYQLPATTGNLGVNLTSVSVITGHQDSRVNQRYDILVSSDGTNFTSLSDGSTHLLGAAGSGFNYSPSGGAGGAASSTVSSNSGPSLATGVYFLEFVALDSGNDVFRELTAVPEPTSIVLFGLGAIGLLMVARRRRRA